ncbi:MAG: asparagine synthase C-terminal domain-containing protein, partial [Gammaproteobacteria bacterium]|nr:asparagine synthase C-terminal domain-containing protein [Gammaproteobacteria bacterium]
LNEYCVTPKDVFDTVPLVTQHFDEPFGNSSAVPTYQCALFAKRSGYDALLAGDGGDELFAGNERYAKQKVFEKYYSIPGIFRWGLLQPLFLGALSGVSFKPIHKMKRYIEQAVIPLPERMLAYNFFNITPPEEILSAAFRSNIDFNEPLNEMKAVYDSCEAENFIDKLLVLDWKFTLTDNDLRKVGVMCEAADISVHYPLLDEKILALSCQIPAQEKLKGSQLRYFYKKAMTGFLSEKTLNKPKHGFGLPFGVWLQTDPGLKEIANDSLSDFAKRDIMTASYLKKLNEQHKHQHASFFGEFIWIILILERWLQERKL